jgi:UDP-N-acetylmuramoyl-tripeptide--D-alanyl-D-alanine ligase
MYHFLQNNNKKVFVNLDDAIQLEKSNFISRYSFSTIASTADVFISNLKANPFVCLAFNNKNIQSQLVGIYNATNIIAAITIGHYFKVADDLIQQAIENYNPTNNRSQISKKGSNQLILDAYNANPSSMKVALQNFCQLTEQHKIAFLGDMFELGTESFNEHKEFIESLTKEIEIQFYFVGQEFYKAKIEQSNFYFFATFEDLKEAISELKFDNNYVLIKGSRGMALERIVDLL